MTRLRDGARVEFVDATAVHAAELVAYMDAVAAESDFLSFGPGEHGATPESQAAQIEAGRARGDLLVRAMVDGELAGYVTVRRSPRPRLEHAGSLGISVRKAFWGRGVGEQMMRHVLARAPQFGLQRIELRVRADNPKARRLYARLGFAEEGRARCGLRIDGQCYDEVLMGWLAPRLRPASD